MTGLTLKARLTSSWILLLMYVHKSVHNKLIHPPPFTVIIVVRHGGLISLEERREPLSARNLQIVPFFPCRRIVIRCGVGSPHLWIILQVPDNSFGNFEHSATEPLRLFGLGSLSWSADIVFSCCVCWRPPTARKGATAVCARGSPAPQGRVCIWIPTRVSTRGSCRSWSR